MSRLSVFGKPCGDRSKLRFENPRVGVASRLHVGWIATAMIVSILFPSALLAQGIDTPRTRLVPLNGVGQGAVGQGAIGNGGGMGSFGTSPTAPPAFDPYAKTNPGVAASLGLPRLSPGGSPAFSGSTTGVTPPSYPSGPFGIFGGGGVPASGNVGPTFGTTFPSAGINSPAYGSGAATGSGVAGPLFGGGSGPAYPGTYDNPSVFGPAVPSLNSSVGAPIGSTLNGGSGYGSSVFGAPGIGSPGFAPPTGSIYPDSIYPSGSPNTLFPGGLFGNGGLMGAGYGTGGYGSPGFSAFRILRGLRLRHSFVGFGDDANDLEVNDTDASVIFAFPNFLYGSAPLYVVPSFSLHLFDGPHSSTGADLPAQTYSAFVDFGYNSDPNQMFGTELGIRVGVFSDFDHVSSDSLRVLGKGLATFRMTPFSTFKLGVYYLDRIDWKLLPAGGILYQPNPYTRFDIFFPQPKLARYWRTIGTNDVWWYLSGDFGGGSWTIKREDSSEDQFDLNDYRAIVGLEWGVSDAIRSGRRTAFAEIGYVFERELIFRNQPGKTELDDGIMFRVGFGY